MSDKVKKGMIVAVCVVVGIVLAVMIAGNFKQPPKAEDKLAGSQSTEKVVVKPEIDKKELDKPKETESKKEEPEKAAPGTEEVTEPSSEPSTEAAQDAGQQAQNIQPRVTKPETPAKEVLENPTQKPDGEAVTGAPVPENHDEVQQPETDTIPGAAPEGESQEGKIYAPGYGWIDDIGEGQVIEDSQIYENGNKIGVMD